MYGLHSKGKASFIIDPREQHNVNSLHCSAAICGMLQEAAFAADSKTLLSHAVCIDHSNCALSWATQSRHWR